MKIWEPRPPGTLWATPGLLRDCFIFFTAHFTFHRFAGIYRYLAVFIGTYLCGVMYYFIQITKNLYT